MKFQMYKQIAAILSDDYVFVDDDSSDFSMVSSVSEPDLLKDFFKTNNIVEESIRDAGLDLLRDVVKELASEIAKASIKEEGVRVEKVRVANLPSTICKKIITELINDVIWMKSDKFSEVYEEMLDNLRIDDTSVLGVVRGEATKDRLIRISKRLGDDQLAFFESYILPRNPELMEHKEEVHQIVLDSMSDITLDKCSIS